MTFLFFGPGELTQNHAGLHRDPRWVRVRRRQVGGARRGGACYCVNVVYESSPRFAVDWCLLSSPP
jgi:hypothetical protein